MKLPSSFPVFCVFACLWTTPALAYIDPGTGSMFLQLLLGGVAGAMVIGRLYWAKLKAIFSRQPPDRTEPESKNPNE